MRSASENLLYDVLVQSNQFPIIKMQYLNDSNNWVYFTDLLNVKVDEKGTKNNYSIFNLVPKSTDISASLQNFDEKYTTGAGGVFDGVLKRDRRVRLWLGYKVTEANPQTEDIPVSEFNTLYHAQIISTKVYAYTVAGITPSLTNFTVDSGVLLFDETPPGDYGQWINEDGDLVVNESGDIALYDSRPRFFAYALSDIQDLFLEKSQEINKINFDSDTDQIYVFYRHNNRSDDILTTNFKYAGQSAAGSNSIDIPITIDRYIQVVFLWANDNYSSTSEYIENVKVGYDEQSEWFNQGEFLMDVPNFSTSVGEYNASFGARDDLKKSIENKISLPAYSSVDVVIPVRDAATRLNIPWDATSLPTLGHTITVSAADTWTNESGIDIFNEIMVYINAVLSNNKFLIMKDGLLTIEDRPLSVTNADYGLSTKDQMFKVKREGQDQNLLGKMIVWTGELDTDDETLIDNSTRTSTGTYVINYSVSSYTGKYCYVNVIADFTGSDPGIYVEITDNDLDGITYEVKGTGTVNVNVKIYGNEIKAMSENAHEAIAALHYVNKVGFSEELVNRLIQSDAEAQAIAEKLILLNGDQFFRVSVSSNALPMLEIGDRVVVLDKKTNLNNIMVIESISKKYDADGASLKQNMTLRDLGWDLENWNWDRHNVINGGQIRGTDDLKYDSNWFWDQDLSTQTEDPTDYSDLRKLQAV